MAELETQLEVYKPKEEVKDLASRLSLMPGSSKLTLNEKLALAQICLAHGFDPFTGDAWAIHDSGIMVGIKGLRKVATREAKKEGGVYWGELRPISPEQYGEPKESVVYEYQLKDTYKLNAHRNQLKMLLDMGIPYADALQMIGPSPVVVGIGIAKPNELSRMGIHQRARKRAESDALKQRYNIDFAAWGGFDTIEEPEFSEPSDDEPPAVILPPKLTTSQILEHLGFEGSEEVPEPPNEPPAEGIPDVVLLPNSYVTMLAFIDKHMGKYDPANAGEKERHLLAGMLDTTFDGDSTKRYEFLKGVAGEASTKKIDGRIVQVLLYDYLGVHGWNDIPSDDALFSIEQVANSTLVARGQQSLPIE